MTKSKFAPRKFTSQDFGAQLKKVRLDLRISQLELARRTELKVSAISHFETGRRLPSFQNIRKLVMALQVSTDSLLGLP